MRSSVETKVLTKDYNVVSFEGVTYVLLRNLGNNDVFIETTYGGTIVLQKSESMQIFAPTRCPLNEYWKVKYPNGDSPIHVTYTYHNNKYE
jgi:hypothetical protein